MEEPHHELCDWGRRGHGRAEGDAHFARIGARDQQIAIGTGVGQRDVNVAGEDADVDCSARALVSGIVRGVQRVGVGGCRVIDGRREASDR